MEVNVDFNNKIEKFQGPKKEENKNKEKVTKRTLDILGNMNNSEGRTRSATNSFRKMFQRGISSEDNTKKKEKPSLRKRVIRKFSETFENFNLNRGSISDSVNGVNQTSLQNSVQNQELTKKDVIDSIKFFKPKKDENGNLISPDKQKHDALEKIQKYLKDNSEFNNWISKISEKGKFCETLINAENKDLIEKNSYDKLDRAFIKKMQMVLIKDYYTLADSSLEDAYEIFNTLSTQFQNIDEELVGNWLVELMFVTILDSLLTNKVYARFNNPLKGFFHYEAVHQACKLDHVRKDQSFGKLRDTFVSSTKEIVGFLNNYKPGKLSISECIRKSEQEGGLPHFGRFLRASTAHKEWINKVCAGNFFSTLLRTDKQDLLNKGKLNILGQLWLKDLAKFADQISENNKQVLAALQNMLNTYFTKSQAERGLVLFTIFSGMQPFFVDKLRVCYTDPIELFPYLTALNSINHTIFNGDYDQSKDFLNAQSALQKLSCKASKEEEL
ncbi:MAG: hypothetical protein Tsb0021_12500 [Chlamydiales bacterium]